MALDGFAHEAEQPALVLKLQPDLDDVAGKRQTEAAELDRVLRRRQKRARASVSRFARERFNLRPREGVMVRERARVYEFKSVRAHVREERARVPDRTERADRLPYSGLLKINLRDVRRVELRDMRGVECSDE